MHTRQTACAQGSVEMRGDAGGADRKIQFSEGKCPRRVFT